MNIFRRSVPRTRRGRVTPVSGLCAAALVILGACSNDPATPSSSADTGSTIATTGSSAASESPATTSDAVESAGFYDTSVLHSVVVAFDQGEYDEMIDAFTETGDKGWITADVTIDGDHYEQVGMRLKGNSSLAGLGGVGMGFPGGDRQPPTSSDVEETTSDPTAAAGPPGGGLGIGSAPADEPEALPWLIRLDKFIEDRAHQGLTEFVVRSNSTETALNEAVSVALLAEAGLATQRATAVEFEVNDRPARLRLVVENPNDAWMADNLGGGKLYKADASGDYSYRGDDPDKYLEAWEQEAGDDDVTPLIEFLDFVNNSDDATFGAELDQHLDVAAFADYMAIEDLLQNFDDISGPGNNSYLYFDPQTGLMTVVAWDHNLALSQLGAGGPGGFDPSQIPGASLPEGFDPTQIPGGSLPDGFDPTQIPGGSLPDGFDPSQIPAGGPNPMGGSNVLADRFMENEEFSALYDAALERLRSELYTSGVAQTILDDWSALLQNTATHLVDSETITTESAAVAKYFVAE